MHRGGKASEQSVVRGGAGFDLGFDVSFLFQPKLVEGHTLGADFVVFRSVWKVTWVRGRTKQETGTSGTTYK